MFPTRVLSSLILLFVFSSISYASGGYGGGGYGGYNSRPVKQVDHAYEYGKSIYQGRESNVAKLNYCIKDEEEKVELRRSVIKKFKNTSYTELANNLYNCDVPTDLIAKSLDTNQLSHVIYYLDKRYKLKLAKK